MEDEELAIKLFNNLQLLHKAKPHKYMNEALKGEAFVLHYIAAHGGDVLPGDISNEMDVSSARIAAALNNLENKGLITRRIDKNDRRKILVGITQEGKDLADKHYRNVVETMAKMIGLMGEQDAREYVRLVGKLAEKLMQNAECRMQNL